MINYLFDNYSWCEKHDSLLILKNSNHTAVIKE